MTFVTHLHPLLATAFKNPKNNTLFYGVSRVFEGIRRDSSAEDCNVSKILIDDVIHMIGEKEKWTHLERNDVSFNVKKELDSLFEYKTSLERT